MIKIGNYNTLRVSRFVDFGAYLAGDNGVEILLPNKYITEDMAIGQDVEVFVYTDSEDRLIATTERPFATVGEFAFLQVKAVNRIGAFLDWGLSKDLLAPFSEQKIKMKEGGVYPVYVYLDDASKRVVASGKFEKYIGNKFPDLKHGDKVEIIPYAHTEIGYKVVVDNLYNGMLYDNELFTPITIGIKHDAWVNRVRDDGKIDLLATGPAQDRIAELAQKIIDKLVANNGHLNMSDSSTPEEIKSEFNCSKKDFKKAIGQLFKNKQILIGEGFIKQV